MANTPVANPETIVDDTAVGTVTWTNPTNAGASDNSYATADTSGGTPESLYTFSSSPDSWVFSVFGTSDANIRITGMTNGQGHTDLMYAATIRLKKIGNPTGTFYVYVSGGGSLNSSDSPVDVSTISTSFANYTFYFNVGTKSFLSSGQTITLIGIKPSITGDASNCLMVSIGNSSGNQAIVDVLGTPLLITHYIKATNFGFTIPTRSIIYGIKIGIERKTGVVTRESEIKIVKSDGSIGSTNKSTGTTLPTTDTYKDYGGSSDLWGEIWTASDINDSDFGVVFSVEGGGIASVDHIRITVYYTPIDSSFLLRMV